MVSIVKWRGAGSSWTGLWETAADWNPNGQPGAGDLAVIGKGVATEDVNQPSNVVVGVEVGAISVAAGAGIVIGDSAGSNRAILTLDDVQTSAVAGSVTVYAAGSQQSWLRASGVLNIASTGSVNLDGGSLIAVNSLTLGGAGVVNLAGGYIGGSSQQAVDKLILTATVTGTGAITGANYDGAFNYNGLVTYNHGVIDAANAASTTDGISIAGGTLYNYGALEAANPSGAIGSSGLYFDFGAVVDNLSGGTISSGTDGFLELDGATIYNGQISGLLYVEGTGNTLTTATNQSLHLDSTTYIDGSLNIGGAGVLNDAYMQVDGALVVKNTFNNNINGVIDVFGTFSTSASGGVGNSGELIADEGSVTFNSSYIEGAGETLIENGGTMRFNISTSNVITFGEGGGTLILDHGSSTGALKDFDLGNNYPAPDGDVINFRDVAFSAGETGTLTQDGAVALLSVGTRTVQLDGVYTTSTTPITFGVGDNGSGFFALAQGPGASTSVVVYPGA